MEVPTIQELLDQLFPGVYIAEELVFSSGEKEQLEVKDDDGGEKA